MNVLADQAARERAVRDFTTPLVVVAGAGTGKTTTLVARVVTWLLGPGFDAARREVEDDARAALRAVDGVLAITFTKAAAAEMDARVRTRLREVEHGAPHPSLIPPADATAAATRARLVRLALDRPLATTIHGFCQGLLAEHPLESGLPPGFVVDADEQLTHEHARRAVREDLAAAFAPAPDAHWLTLGREGLGPDRVAQVVAKLRVDGVRAAELAGDPTADDALAPFVAALESAVQAFVPHARTLAGVTRAKAVQRTAEAILALASLRERGAGGSPRERLQGFVACDLDDLAKPLRAWARGEFGQSAGNALGESVAAAARAASELERALRPLIGFDPDAFRARLAIVRRVLARAEAAGAAAAVVTFGDLLARAAELVERDAGVRARLRRRYRQILIDEFQDTDDVQVRLVRALGLGAGRDRPGLFLVGDPKQSIYGFRGADLAAYDGFVDEVLAGGGERLELVQNFRSTPRVLAAVTRFVEPVMQPEHGVQPPFQPLVPRGDEPGPAIELWATWSPHVQPDFDQTKVDVARRLEARALADALRRLHAERIAWKDMAVLARSRASFTAALELLRDAGIPVQVEGDRSYFRRREVVDASALFGAIADPGDTLSLVAFLRSAACGLPDAALEPLFAHGFAEDAQRLGGPDSDAALARIARAAHALEPEVAGSFPPGRSIPHWADALEHALASLAILRRSLADDPADTCFERLRALLLLEAAEGSRWQGAHRLANLERFLRRARAELLACGDPAAVLRALRRALDERRDEREARPAADVEDAVRFLTIHGAKGLEFEAVFLLGMASGQARRGDSDGFDRASGALRLCGRSSPAWAAVAAARERRDAAERARLLYVALTRAKSRLVLSATWRVAPELRAWSEAASFRDLGEHGLPPDFGARAQAAHAQGRLEFDAGGCVARLATSEPEPVARTPGARAAAQRVERARREAAELETSGLQAEARAGRPLVARASRAERDDPPGAPSPVAAARGRLSRAEARALGTLVHAALEQAPDFEAARTRLEREALRSGTPAAVRAEACTILDSVAGGPLAARFAAHTILARELDLLVPALDGEQPVEAWTGAADLVLRDATGWVVVDYKTEPLAGRDPRDAAREHAPQLGRYARALAEALGLPAQPRGEVWFLRDGVAAALD
ncbi:MAG: UvrD-helicase domain-containing protein [Planctomycetes bacterium]|nr:UvrD-helicase domain-containing protein [Planctomycetota bacterium]